MSARSEVDVWPDGRECAVSLTYDGVLGEHLSTVVPLLNDLNLKGTFFASPTRILDDPLGWRKVAETHELGNHSLYGVADGGTLLNWDIAMVEADIKVTNSLMAEIIGQVCKSFALPGWSTACAQGDYLPTVQRLLPYVRSERREMNDWKSSDLGYLGSYPLEQIDCTKLVQQARKKKSWVVFRVGSLEDAVKHERTLKGFAAAKHDIWIAPFGEVASRVSSLRAAQELTR